MRRFAGNVFAAYLRLIMTINKKNNANVWLFAFFGVFLHLERESVEICQENQ
jgi:hypothetical protein